MTQERTLVILAQILAVLILLNIFSSYNEGYDPRLENHKRNQDDVSDIEGNIPNKELKFPRLRGYNIPRHGQTVHRN